MGWPPVVVWEWLWWWVVWGPVPEVILVPVAVWSVPGPPVVSAQCKIQSGYIRGAHQVRTCHRTLNIGHEAGWKARHGHTPPEENWRKGL